MKNFTQIQNWILSESGIPLAERFLLCVLVKYSWGKSTCNPSQQTLAKDIGFSVRYTRELLSNLQKRNLIQVKHFGLGSSNEYYLSKLVRGKRIYSSYLTGAQLPTESAPPVPTNNTHEKYIEKSDEDGFKILSKKMDELGLKKNSPLADKKKN